MEARIELARLDERIKALQREIDHTEIAGKRALEVAASELARRLDNLNHAHQQAVEVQGTYVPRETFSEVEKRVSVLELDSREQRGKMWLPMIAVATMAAAVAAAVVKFFLP